MVVVVSVLLFVSVVVVVACADVLMCCDADALLRQLFTSFSRNQKKKLMIFFST